MNKDQIKGRVEEAKGTVKKVAGTLVGNESLAQKGRMQKAAGKAQAGLGDARNHLKQGS